VTAPAPSATLTVDLAALAANWRAVASLSGSAETAAAVKADGYGLGAVKVSRALVASGARSFFVATPSEGARLRAALGRMPRIFVLNGLPQGAAPFYEAHALIPVLNSFPEAQDWAACSTSPCALQIDTGMARLGLSGDDLDRLLAHKSVLAKLNLSLILSHLACADEPRHPLNREQLSRFNHALARLPPAPASLSASAGVLLGPAYRFDLVRPGIALYGGHPSAAGRNPFQPVVRLTARILAMRTLKKGESAGYGATFTVKRRTHLATCGIGYADGLFRALSNKGIALVKGCRAPYAGRVSMDLLILDVSRVPGCAPGDEAELIGQQTPIGLIARSAGTNAYEVLTSLGNRFARVYVGGP